MEKTRDQRTGESKVRIVEQVQVCLRSGDYPRAMDSLRRAAAEFPNDAELSELEKSAQDGIKRKAEADRLITESQELFAQRKSAEAIQLLRKAYELDKKNSLARSILANALVEHANSIVETDWLEAETLTNQALALNPAHPTAKTVHSLIADQKKTSSVNDWVTHARKRQSSGDLFAALAWVAEGLAVHPDDPKLLQVQDAIQRDQSARRRQARRGDLADLRRMELEIDRAADAAAKQALAERIQGLAAKYWTDGEILSIANGLLHRLGLAPKESSSASPRSKGAAVIFHVPRPSAPVASRTAPIQVPPSTGVPSQVSPSPILQSQAPPKSTPLGSADTRIVLAVRVPASVVPPPKVPRQVATIATTEPPAPADKVASPSSRPKRPSKSNPTTLILVSAAAIALFAAVFFFARKHSSSPVAKTPSAAPSDSATVSTPAVAPPAAPPAAIVAAPAQPTPEPSVSALSPSSDNAPANLAADGQLPADSARNVGTLLVVVGQEGARVSLNGKVQPQLTRAGELRLPNLDVKDYVVEVSKSGFQDPPQQTIRIRKGEQAKLVFNLQPQPHRASLTIQGAAPGTTVLLDQAPVGTVQPDGSLSVTNVNPGDHTVELRKERFKPRQFKKHFVAGETTSLAAAEVALETAPGELKITFAPADANVAIVKGDLLRMVSSGVPLSLAPGTYTLTARTAERFTRSATVEVVAGQSKTLDLSLAPNGMSKWEDPGAWKHEGDAFIRKGGDFVLYGVVPASGTFIFSAMPAKGHLVQWVLNYTDPKDYVLCAFDDNNFYRSVIRNGEKTDEIIIPHIGEKKSFRTLQIRVSPTEVFHQIKQGESWRVLDRWTQPGVNLSAGKFGFYIPGNDQVALSGFSHYADLSTR
ncbi:MAG TPA: hypothetical protein VMG82_06705 [Candidatus Sulfotelmatobacter sp.]|nr:hypothetical protein [Candidatus Sulfotelmatobacter sp.]